MGREKEATVRYRERRAGKIEGDRHGRKDLSYARRWEKVRPRLTSYMKDAAHPIAQIQKSFQNGPGALASQLPLFLETQKG